MSPEEDPLSTSCRTLRAHAQRLSLTSCNCESVLSQQTELNLTKLHVVFTQLFRILNLLKRYLVLLCPFSHCVKRTGCFYQLLTTTVAFSFLEHPSLTFFKRNFELKAGRNKPCLCVSLTACCQPTFSLKAVQQHSKQSTKRPLLEIKHLAKKTADTFLPRRKQESCFAKLLRVAGLVLFN